MHSLLPFVRLFMREHKRAMLLGFVLSALAAISAIGLLSLSGWFISAAAFAGLTAATAYSFNYYLPAAGVRFFALTRIAAGYGDRVVNHNTTFKLLADLRVWFYKKLEPLVPAYLLKSRSADLLSRLIDDVDALDNLYIRVLIPIGLLLLITVILFVYMLFFSYAIAFLLLGMMLIAGLVLPGFMHKLGLKPGESLVKNLAAMRELLVETFQALKEVVLFNAQQRQLTKMIEKEHDWFKAQRKMSYIKGMIMAIMLLLSGLTLWLVLYIGIGLVNSQALDGANLALIALTVLAAFEFLLPLPLALQYLGKTQMAAKRLLDVAAEKPVVVFQQAKVQQISSHDIRFSHINFSYPKSKPILSDFSLHIAQGEHVVIQGPSGSGKSTLGYLLARCWDPESGNIKIGNVELSDFSETQLRETLTYIPQNPHIFNASIRDNLLLAKPDAQDSELFGALAIAMLDKTINEMKEGLDTWLGESGERLSGGELKRLAVAQAVLRNSPITILDEFNEGMNEQMAEEILRGVQQFFHDKTLILIAHHMPYNDSRVSQTVALA